jgi:hypothetical protein
MDFHKIWEEQCEATRAIRERFGRERTGLSGRREVIEFC